jgi:hypothetical protein
MPAFREVFPHPATAWDVKARECRFAPSVEAKGLADFDGAVLLD